MKRQVSTTVLTGSSRPVCRWVLAIVAGCCLVVSGWANGFRNPPEGAAAVARPGGKLVFTEDASAVVHNPANLAGRSGPDAMASLTMGFSEVKYNGVSGNGKTDNDPSVMPSLFYAHPLPDRDITLGLGIHSPYGQFTDWGTQGPFAYTAPYFAQLTTVNVSPVVAANLGERVKIGVGADIMWGELTLKSQFPFGDMLGIPGVPPGQGKIEIDGTDVGGHLGITVDVSPRHRLSATYRSQIDLGLSGDFTVNNVPPPMAPMIQPSVGMDSEIRFPNIVALGYGWTVNEQVRLGLDVEWIEFSRFSELPLDADGNQNLLPGPSIPQNWEDTWTFNLGAEVSVSEAWTVLGGYAFLESPIPPETMAPTLPDADRHVIAAGAQWAHNQHRVDVAYAYSLYDDLTVEQNINPAYVGSYDLSAHLFLISYNLSL